MKKTRKSPAVSNQAHAFAKVPPEPESASADTEIRRQLHELAKQDAELRKARDEAAASHPRYADRYDFAPIAYFTLDPSGAIEQVNLAGTKLLRKSRSQVLGRRLDAFLAEESRSPFIDFLARLLARREKERCDVVLPGPAQRRRLIHLIATTNHSGRACLAATFDITDCRTTELALREREERLRQALERLNLAQRFAGAGTWDWNVQTGRIDWSPELFRLFGLDPAKTVAGFETWRSVVHPEDRTRAEEPIDTAVRTRAPFRNEYRIVLPTGAVRWIKALGNIRYDDHGEPLNMAGICLDITPCKQTELALKEATWRYKTMAGFAYDWEVWENPDGTVRYCSPSCKRITGYSAKEFYLHASLLTAVIVEEDRNNWVKYRQAMVGGKPSPLIQFRIRRKDAKIIWIEQACRSVTDKNGVFLGYRASNRDITERKQAEEALREREERSRQQLAELQSIYESAPIGLCVFDRDLRYVRINKRLAEMHGVPAADHIGKTPSQVIPSLAPMTRELAERIFLTGEGVTDVEFSGTLLAHPDAKRTCVEQWLPLKDTAGHIVGINVVVEDITRHRAAEDEIKHLAFYDPLTRLPNRRLLVDRLLQALAASARNRRPGALLFIDLDNFKSLNDTLGHDQGDLLLQQVAERLVACVRESDTVARFGGDEFIVMLEGLTNISRQPATQAQTVGEKILAALNQPYSLAGHEYYGTTSMGITLFSDRRETVDELLKQADLAMYQAKSAGRNALRFFDPGMQAALEARAALEAELRSALRAGQFLLHYQPQVDGEGRVTGVEALLRWQHPRRGLVFPASFMPLAEETGLIHPLGRWVLETACRQLVTWESQPETSHLTLAVNISNRQFRHPNFVDEVLKVLDHTGADPRQLKLELTESLLLDDATDAIAKMTALKMRGVGFSLDDFGTGHSSLSHLKQLPWDELKIDQSFVTDLCTNPDDASLARIVLSLGQSLGMTVIAEGVETEAQGNFLADQGCQAFQGYLFGRSGPMDTLQLAASTRHTHGAGNTDPRSG